MALHRESTVATQNTTLFFKALSSSKQFLFAFRARGNLSFLFYCYVWELWQNMISCAWTLMSPGFRRMWKISILFSLQILSSFKQKKKVKWIESSWFVRLRIDRAIYMYWHECHLLWSKKRNVNLRSARFFMLWVPFIFSWFLKIKMEIKMEMTWNLEQELSLIRLFAHICPRKGYEKRLLFNFSFFKTTIET